MEYDKNICPNSWIIIIINNVITSLNKPDISEIKIINRKKEDSFIFL